MRMAIAFKHLAKRPDGRTHIAGRRLTPYDMLCQYELGGTPETLSEGYDLSLAEVYEALAYAFDHPDQMERIREDNKAADERIIDQLPEHLREIARQTAAADELAYQETARNAREARRGIPVP